MGAVPPPRLHADTHREGIWTRKQEPGISRPAPRPGPSSNSPAENRQGSCTRGTTSVSWSPIATLLRCTPHPPMPTAFPFASWPQLDGGDGIWTQLRQSFHISQMAGRGFAWGEETEWGGGGVGGVRSLIVGAEAGPISHRGRER